jgi:hypothetical protein
MNTCIPISCNQEQLLIFAPDILSSTSYLNLTEQPCLSVPAAVIHLRAIYEE